MATSGTTGTAKGVILTHGAVLASAQATSQRLGVDPAEHRWLACLPLNHVGGMSVVTRSLLTGTPLAVLPGFDRDAGSCGRRARGARVAGADRAGSGRRGALPHRRARRVSPAGRPPGQRGPHLRSHRDRERGGLRWRAPSRASRWTSPRTPGRSASGAPCCSAGYRDGTEALDADGWLATGDAGELDADGRLRVHGRLTEVIISGGENIWPAPVEAALLTHPSVAEVAVAGTPDPEWGQRVVAWVVPADPAALPVLGDLRRLVAETSPPLPPPARSSSSTACPARPSVRCSAPCYRPRSDRNQWTSTPAPT